MPPFISIDEKLKHSAAICSQVVTPPLHTIAPCIFSQVIGPIEGMDLPNLRLESPGQRPWVQKLALDSLPSPSPGAQPNLQLQNLATKHWRKMRDQVFAKSFVSELQKAAEEDEEDEEYNIYTTVSSEASSPQSPQTPKKPWSGSPDVSMVPTSVPALQLLQAQLQEATEEIERLYSEKEDVEHMLKQVRRSSIRLEHIPDPDSPQEEITEPLQAAPQMSPLAMFDRRVIQRNLTLTSDFPVDHEPEHYAELLAEERRLRNQETDAWEIERSNLEDKQSELRMEVAAALGEAEAAMERRELSIRFSTQTCTWCV